MKIVIDENIPFIRGAFEPWADVVYSPGRRIDARMVADADALIIRTRTRCNAALLQGSSVRIVASATIGFDHIDTGWLGSNGIRWVNAPGCNSGSVMQYITSLLFFLARRYSLDLRSMTLGIVGVGNVGSKVERAARAIGMRVLLNDPPRERREGNPGFLPLETLLRESDILTLHVPLTRDGEDRTFHLIGSHNMAKMKRSTILVNSSRGEVVDNIALSDALEYGWLRGAALDVWENEPVADPHLVDMTDIATPHIAGYSVDGKANATISSVRSVAMELGLPLTDWLPADLPEPSEPLIDLTGSSVTLSEAGGNKDLGEGARQKPGSITSLPENNNPATDGIYHPESDNPVSDVINNPGSFSLNQVALAVKHTYPIEEDDSLFRNGKENFEYLRDNYRIRREFGSYRVRTDDGEAAGILSELGFQIII